MRRSLRRSVLWTAGAVVAAVLASWRLAHVDAQRSGDYLPLTDGARWELRSGIAPDAMVLEVIGRDGDAWLVNWVNPWIKSVFRFVKQGTDVHLTGLDMGQGVSPIPSDTIYWSFGRRKGDRWTSAVGTQRITDTEIRVSTPSGTYEHAIEIETRDQKGQSMYWTFAPGVGLVRFGQGRDAWLLTSYRAGGATTTRREPDRRAAPPPPSRAGRGAGALLVGIDANPWDGAKETEALQRALDAGMTLVHLVPTWNDIERSAGKYTWNAYDVRAKFASDHGLPVALNFRIVDTNNRSMPKSYAAWAWDDTKMVERVRAALRAMRERTKAQVRLVAIGNEVDGYFARHRNEVSAYANLLRQVRDTVRQEFPEALFTTNFAFAAVGQLDGYRAITEQFDVFSFTYYPLNPDFTMRPPDVVGGDIERMLDVAGDRPVYIQEIGYPSSERLRSSPALQAQFVTGAFDSFRRHRSRIVGATFLFMSDLPRSMVDFFAQYYGSNNENFKAYLQTLGLIDRGGRPKPAWDVLSREAQAIKQAR
jgi:hypothetical protein